MFRRPQLVAIGLLINFYLWSERMDPSVHIYSLWFSSQINNEDISRVTFNHQFLYQEYDYYAHNSTKLLVWRINVRSLCGYLVFVIMQQVCEKPPVFTPFIVYIHYSVLTLNCGSADECVGFSLDPHRSGLQNMCVIRLIERGTSRSASSHQSAHVWCLWTRLSAFCCVLIWD